jgi:hypothetical protein
MTNIATMKYFEGWEFAEATPDLLYGFKRYLSKLKSDRVIASTVNKAEIISHYYNSKDLLAKIR